MNRRPERSAEPRMGDRDNPKVPCRDQYYRPGKKGLPQKHRREALEIFTCPECMCRSKENACKKRLNYWVEFLDTLYSLNTKIWKRWLHSSCDHDLTKKRQILQASHKGRKWLRNRNMRLYREVAKTRMKQVNRVTCSKKINASTNPSTSSCFATSYIKWT